MAKRVGFTLLQLLVTATGIYYVFHDPQKRAQITPALGAADWRWLALSWLVYGTVEMIATVRWQMLLRVQGIVAGWFRSAVIVMVGLFFNMFLPGLVGGDAIRLYLLFQSVPRRKMRATLSVAMDRLLGLVSLFVLAALVVLLRFGWLNQAPQTAHITYLAFALLGAATFLALLLFGAISRGEMRRWARRLPFRHAIRQIGEALNLYRAHPGIVAGALLLTIVSHLTYYLSYYCALRSASSSRPRGEIGRFPFHHAIGEHDHWCANFLRRCRCAGDAFSDFARTTRRNSGRGSGVECLSRLRGAGVVGSGRRSRLSLHPSLEKQETQAWVSGENRSDEVTAEIPH